MMWRRSVFTFALALVVAGCASPPAASRGDAADAQGQPGAVKRLTAAVMSDPKSLGPEGGPVPGKGELEGLMHVGLSNLDNLYVRRASLAEEVPTTENGLWKLLPDGRMETTWKLRPNIWWHDGAPFSAADILFTSRVEQDREMTVFRRSAYRWVESVEAPDDRTITVRWTQPYIDADTMFEFPLPMHLLEKPFVEQKLDLPQQRFWTDGFTGTGPYRLREWVRGSNIFLDANEQYVLGRPKIDQIEVKLIPDSNTLLANILSGTVEMTLSRGLSLEQAVQLRDQWRDGTMYIVPTLWILIYPQLYYSNPPVVADVRFRRAMLHAIDRQALVDTLQVGQSQVAHSIMDPGQPQYRNVEARLPRYDYDPRRAATLLQELGYTRGTDGALRGADGQKLSIELRCAPTDINLKSMLAVADYWHQTGVEVTQVPIPPAQQGDVPYRATFPAFELLRNPNDLRLLPNLHSSQVKKAENGWSGSYTGYHNPEYDALLEKYQVTIPQAERLQVIEQLVHHIADQVVVMGLFYDTLPSAVSHRVQGVVGTRAEGNNRVWSAFQWEVR